jgi:hypothetical protein
MTLVPRVEASRVTSHESEKRWRRLSRLATRDSRPLGCYSGLIRPRCSLRTMLAGPPPYRVVCPGICYRNDTFDASHLPAFTQMEGLAR